MKDIKINFNIYYVNKTSGERTQTIFRPPLLTAGKD